MQANFLKELKLYFSSMTVYVFLAIFFFIAGVMFFSSVLFVQSGDIAPFFSGLSSQILFCIPLLTMRSFSEEKKLKTDQLLFTLPISEWDVVLSKFLACMAFYAMALVLTVIFPITLALLGSPQPLVSVGNYVGVLLFGAMLIAIGLFVSSLTENQVVSAVVSYSISLFLWMSGIISSYVSQPILKTILRYTSANYYFEPFTLGIFDLSNVMYYLAMTTLFLGLACHLLKLKRVCY